MNVELLLKIADVIQNKPEEFNINQWHKHGTCTTTHCIGGWSQVLTGSEQNRHADEMAMLLGIEFIREPNSSAYYHDEIDVIHAADNCQSGRLFYLENWPSMFQMCDDCDYDCEDHPYKNPTDAAVARIHHFIATEGRE